MAGSFIAIESGAARGQHWQKQSQPSSAVGAGKTNLMVDAFPAEGVSAPAGATSARWKYDILMDPFTAYNAFRFFHWRGRNSIFTGAGAESAVTIIFALPR